MAALIVLAGCAAPPAESIGSFGNFTPPDSAPHYLACPRDYCVAAPDQVTVLRPLPAERLRDIVRAAIDAEPDAKLLSSANFGLRLVYRQAGGALGGDDTVTIEIIDADEGLSGLALYSQSRSTGPDFGATRARARAWIADIDAAVARRGLR